MPKAVIMAGGQGERFWPLTHPAFPKYRIKLDGKFSLLQKTVQRLERLYGKKDIFVVTTQEHAKLIRRELPALPKQNILIEPARKNTAPAILFSCQWLASKFGSDEIVSFFPADHLIQNEALFQKTLNTAIALAKKNDVLVTVGIKPTFPATGYGYIEAGQAGAVKRFREKPDRKTAEKFIKQKKFLWNGGIFTWKAGVLIDGIKKHTPELLKLDLNKLKASYGKLPNISIDYALLEKAKNISVVPTSMDWCDMGSWDMFLNKAKIDADGNWMFGRCRQKESKNSLLLNYTDKPLVVLGLVEMIAVKSERGVLVCRRTRSEEAALLARQA